MERGVRDGNAAAKQQQTKLLADLKSAMKKKESDRVQLEQEMKKWEDFREKREDIVLGKMSFDRSQKEKAEQVLREFQRVKEEHVKRRRLRDAAPHAGGAAEEPDDDDRRMQDGAASNALKCTRRPTAGRAVGARPTSAEKSAGGYSDSVALERCRRECWEGHGFKAVGSSSVEGTGGSGRVQQQQKL